MKKVLLLLSFLVAFFVSNAQYPVVQFLGRDSALVDSRGGFKARLINYPFTDTTQANTQRISQYPGAFIYTTSGGDKLWLRNSTATGWDRIGTASGGGGGIVSIGTSAYGLIIQNDSTYKVDTSQVSTKLWRQKGIDSVQNNLTIGLGTKLNITDTANMRVRLYAGSNVTITGTYPNLTIASSGGGGGGTTISDSTLQWVTNNGDSTTNRIVTNDSLKGLNQYIHGSVNIGDTVQGTKQFVFFGNSVTAGYNLTSPTTERFSYLVSRIFGAIELNRGRSGTRMTHSGVSSDSCMIDRIPLIPTYASPYAAIFFDYGLNDDQAGVDTSTFKTSYNRVVDTCIARGWPTNKIFLLAPSYNWYSLTPNTDDFARATRTVAESKSVEFVDVYNYMINNGGTSLIQADSLHPNALGNIVTAQSISQHIRTDFKRVGDLIVTGDNTTKGKIYFKSNASGTDGGMVALDDTNTGFGVLSGNSDYAYVVNGGAPSVAFARNFMQGDANFQYAWTIGSSGGFAGGSDAGIAKQGAAALRISNGSTGYGSLAASAFKTHGTTSGDVTLQSATGTWTMTLPTSAGTSGYVLQTDGTGVTSWVAQSGGGGTTYKIGTYNTQTSSTNGASIVSDSIYMQAFSAENPGLVPAGGSGSTFLRGDGTWQTVAGGTVYVDSVSNNAGGDSLVVIKNSVRSAYKYPAGGSSGITIGTTGITSGTSRHILFDSSGLVKQNSYLQFNTSNQLLLRGGGPGASTPSIASANATSTGIELFDATNGVSINVNGTREVAFFSSGILGDNGMVVGWNNTSSGAYGGSRNVGITYGADKTIKVVDATTGNGSFQAYLRPYAGTATAGTSPLKFTSGTNLTTAEAGAVEYNGTNFFVTPGTAVRETVVTDINTLTLTNKRITSRVSTTASSSSLTINSDNSDRYTVTALAADMTINNPSGTPTDGQTLLIRIKDNGTARALTWSGSQFRVIGVTLPTTTVISKTVYIGLIWNSADSKWDVVSVNQEA